MFGYRDMTFCPFYEVCAKGGTCDRTLTLVVLKAADKWWGGDKTPIAQFCHIPECHEESKMVHPEGEK